MGDVTPLPDDQDHTGRSFGEEELTNLESVLESGVLFGPKGTWVKKLEASFSDQLGVGHTVACSSGTAAVHTAIAVVDPAPGDEVITTAVTDMGALTPILYQGAIPVFADVDPSTGNLTADTIADRISERTVAIVATHLFGNPCDMDGIGELAAGKGLAVIEDCAQAFTASYNGRNVGTFGDLATFSLQQGKHMTSGEGGLVTSQDDRLAQRAKLFVNKAWDYDDPSDHEFLALNYRMSELQAAVAVAQLDKLPDGARVRRQNAERLDKALADLRGIEPLVVLPGGDNSYWRYAVTVDPGIVGGGPVALSKELAQLGFPSAPRYVKKPAFQCGIFANHRTMSSSGWPFSIARDEALDYSVELFPGTFELLDRILVFPWNERYTPHHVDRLAQAIADALTQLPGGRS